MGAWRLLGLLGLPGLPGLPRPASVPGCSVSGFAPAALDAWRTNTEGKLRRVVVYRDGVGDGQLKAVLEHEVQRVKEFLQDQHEIELTFIVVKKRINTRFYQKYSDQYSNPPVGTVVDTAITRREWYDFYIVSHSSREGTITPTHYNVICDEIGLEPDFLQNLTYKLCHMYYNYKSGIRVPAPCQYAHKLAYLVGKNIQQQPDKSLSKVLYYL